MIWEVFFLKNHAQTVVEGLVPDPFIKNWNISGSAVRNVIKFIFFGMPNLRSTQIYQNLSADHLLLPYIKLLQKQKEIWN